MVKAIFSLGINPGSTSTKIAVYKDDQEVFKKSIAHKTEELKNFATIWDQYDFRKKAILETLKEQNFSLENLDVIVCRGGNIKPVPGGTFMVSPQMLEDAESGKYGIHAATLGMRVGFDFGEKLGIPVLTVDVPATDEMCVYAKYSGLPQIERKSRFHALNQKAVARKFAAQSGKEYEDLNLIIIHLGGGISVGAHQKGKVIDVNNALDGDGPFAPERAGGLPAEGLVKLCYSGVYTEPEVSRLLNGKGGLVAYLGTSSGLEVTEMINAGDKKAEEVFMAMGYKVAKEIGAAAAVLDGDVDGIIFTGSLAYSKILMDFITNKVKFIGKIYMFPGENEMEALALGALRFLRGEEALKSY
ncbi:MAG: butyrate kinase [Clostridiaceae bacterium]